MSLLPLLHVVLVLAAIGFIVWVIVKYIPMPEVFRNVIIAVVVIGLVLWMLQYFDLFTLPRR